jgi:DNA mismatch repair protein PMS2
VDNGSGIDETDWQSIGLKHHTSKLPSLEELAQVDTFGFRGEALSALCALCESVTVTTATKETAPMGAVIKLGKDGRVLDDKGRVARQVRAAIKYFLLTLSARNDSDAQRAVQATSSPEEGV